MPLLGEAGCAAGGPEEGPSSSPSNSNCTILQRPIAGPVSRAWYQPSSALLQSGPGLRCSDVVVVIEATWT